MPQRSPDSAAARAGLLKLALAGALCGAGLGGVTALMQELSNGPLPFVADFRVIPERAAKTALAVTLASLGSALVCRADGWAFISGGTIGALAAVEDLPIVVVILVTPFCGGAFGLFWRTRCIARYGERATLRESENRESPEA
jgi:hypothetical protein